MSDQELQQLFSQAKSGTPSQPTSGVGSGDFLDNVANAAPTVGGLLGGISGAVLGTPADIVTGPLGTAIGGAGGAAIGGAGGQGIKNIINLLRGQKQTAPGNVKNEALAGAEQAPWGALGGADELIGAPLQAGVDAAKAAPITINNPLARFAAKTALRGGAGALAGGGSKIAQNVSQGNPYMQGVPQSALTTGAINIGTGAVGDYAGQLKKDIPKVTTDAVETKAKQIYNDAMSNAVGHYNLTDAEKLGITPKYEEVSGKMADEGVLSKNTIDTMMNNRVAKSNEVEKQLQGVLKSAPKVPSTDVKNILDHAAENMGISSDQLLKKLDIELPGGNQTIVLNTQGEPVASGTRNISLADVNKIKRAVGDYYSEGEARNQYNALYTNLRKYIEEKSGNSSQIAELNQTSQRLSDIGQNLRTIKEKTQLPSGQSHDEITNSLNDARYSTTKKLPASLQSLQSLAALGGGLTAGGITTAAGGNLGLASGGALGGMFVGRRLGQTLTENPEVLNALNTLLNAPQTDATGKILRQIMLRGGTLGGQ